MEHHPTRFHDMTPPEPVLPPAAAAALATKNEGTSDEPTAPAGATTDADAEAPAEPDAETAEDTEPGEEAPQASEAAPAAPVDKEADKELEPVTPTSPMAVSSDLSTVRFINQPSSDEDSSSDED